MRWLLAVGGALALVAGTYLALRPRLTRPVLRVGVGVRDGFVEDAAVAAGVALALDERDEGGRFRVAVVPHRMDGHGVSYSKTTFKIWMPGVRAVPQGWLDPSGATLIAADVGEEADVLLSLLKARGLRRVAVPTSTRPRERVLNSSYAVLDLPQVAHALEGKTELLWPPGPDLPPDRLSRWTVDARPDLVLLEGNPYLVQDVRAAGFEGPVVLASACLATNPMLDGCLTVLAPLKPPPAGFRHPSPFAYAGHLAALRFLDAMDVDPAAEPQQLCVPWVFDELRGEPRVYEVRGGRFVPR